MVGRFSTALGAVAPVLLAGACISSSDTSQGSAGAETGSGDQTSEPFETSDYRVTELVTDETDPDLVNPWGIAPGEGVFWIADEGTGKVSVYDGNGRPSEEYPTGRFDLGEGITGVAALEADEEGEEEEDGEDEDAFLIDTGSGCETPAEFVFARMNGTLVAINDDAPEQGVVVADRSSTGAVYLGVAKVDMPTGPVLLAADFANARIDMFDAEFQLITSETGAQPFVDTSIPEGFAPFNVMALGERVYVTYAKQSEDEPGEEEPGPGLGQVSIFDTTGAFVGRIESELLNAPWGVAVPEHEEACGSEEVVLVGNFGDGRITAFDQETLRPLGQLSDTNGQPIVLEGLWGIVFGSDEAGDEGALYFVSGPDDEQGGIFGRIDRVSTN